jgi:CubicO group peptidase (beta-lactamase class C family)
MKQIAELIESLRQEHHVPAVQVGIFRGNETIFIGGSGYRDVGRQQKADENTSFAIGSQTKSFIGTAVALLADEGKIQLDKPVKEYIPEFAMEDGYLSETLTVRDILSHRSGLPNHEFMLQLNIDHYGAEEYVRKIRYLKASAPVRSKMQYSNLMYLLAGHLIERVTGETWSEFIKRRLLVPIGMENTNFSVAENRKLENRALPYCLTGGNVVEMPAEEIKAVSPAGAMNSTLIDMLKWLRFHLDMGCAGDRSIVSAGGIQECHSPQIIIKENPPIFKGEMQFRGYGLGWFTECYRGHWIVHHGGGIDGFIAEMGIIPELDAGFAIYSNLDGNFVPPILQFSICDYLIGLPEVDWNQRFGEMMATGKMLFAQHIRNFQPSASENAKSLPIENYAGVYHNEAYGKIVIRQDRDSLVFQARKLEIPLRHVSNNAFLLLHEEKMLAVPMQFVLDMQGRVTGVDVDFEPTIGAMIRYRKAEEKQGV